MSFTFWLLAGLPPFLVALGVTGLLRVRGKPKGGRKWSAGLAETGPVLGFLAGFIGIAQGVPFLANMAHHRVGEAAVLALAVAVGFALVRPGRGLGAMPRSQRRCSQFIGSCRRARCRPSNGWSPRQWRSSPCSRSTGWCCWRARALPACWCWRLRRSG
ncbi:MAG: hypothetical protein WDN69_26910 [Aliidongia sp.]